MQGYFWCSKRPNFRGRNSQWNLGEFPINFEKKNHNLQKKKYFFLRLGFSFSYHTHKLHGDSLLPLNLISPSVFFIAKVCVIAYLFFVLTKNDIIVQYKEFTALIFPI